MSILPINPSERKAVPIYSGVLAYFPKTIVALARLSLAGGIQHYGPDAPLHWNREVSKDHQDCMIRHTMQSGTEDTDGILHDVKAAWRALAQCEVVLDRLAARVPNATLEDQIAAVATIIARVPPYVERDADDPMGLTAGQAIDPGESYGGSA
jgi:hypothetical protein